MCVCVCVCVGEGGGKLRIDAENWFGSIINYCFDLLLIKVAFL